MSELPEWPVCEAENCDDYEAFYDYSHKRYQAAMARLRKLTKAADRFMASELASKHSDYGCVDALDEALKAIGELPPE